MMQRGNPGLFDQGPFVLFRGTCCHGYWKLQMGKDHFEVVMKVFPDLLSSCSLCLFV